MQKNFKKIFIIALSLFLIFAFKAHGQLKSASPSDVADSTDITTIPAFPGANENVLVRIESFSFDLNSSEIIWALDGKIQSKGIGNKSFSFITGKIGSVSLVKIIIKTKVGKTIEKTLFVRPAGVDIVWEADSYVPPFYKGKALYSYQGLISIIAIPDIINSSGVKINPKDLTYKWTMDSKVLGDVSGYGKNKFSFSKSIISHSPEIKVEVMSSDKKIKASGSITLEAIEPKTVIYENNPLYGIIYEKAAVGDFKLSGSEITIVAIPYFFSTEETRGNSIKYDWSMNGRSINNKPSDRQKTFRNTDGSKGSTRISVDLQNDGRELQSARTDVLLNFEGSAGNKTISF